MDIHQKYTKEVIPAMQKKFGYKNAMAVPRVSKVIVHTGVGRIREEKDQEEIRKYLARITGQKPAPRTARKAIASFKTREGLVIGYQTTLRRARMYDFLNRLIRATLPRVRDFQGIDTHSFDPRGNLTLGIKEHIVFPELIGEDYRFLFGLAVTVATTARKKEEGIELLRLLGFPLRNS